MKIEDSKGWAEFIIDENCSSDKFYEIADILHTSFGIAFRDKVFDYDTIYWDFSFKQCELILHYNIFFGVSFFPKALVNAHSADNKAVIELANSLTDYFKNPNDPINAI